jgi:hypothetical protein
MAKYKLIALSVQISGKLFLKENGDIFDTETTHAAMVAEVEAAEKSGHLEKIEEPKTEKKK